MSRPSARWRLHEELWKAAVAKEAMGRTNGMQKKCSGRRLLPEHKMPAKNRPKKDNKKLSMVQALNNFEEAFSKRERKNGALNLKEKFSIALLMKNWKI
jgi:hypothetical protein